MIHRFASAVLALIIVVFAGALLLALVGIPEAWEFFPSQSLRDSIMELAKEPAMVRVLVALGSLTTIFVLLFLLLRGVLDGLEEEPLTILADDLGCVVVERDSVSLLVESACRPLDGLWDLAVKVKPGHIKGLILACQVTVRPGTDINDLTRRVRERARDAVERLVGIAVEEVNIRTVVTKLTGKRRLIE